MAIKLSNILDCPLVMTDFSRLLIDPNRGIDDPTLIMKISDNSKIEGNIGIKNFQESDEKNDRIKNFYDLYHNKISELINCDFKYFVDTAPVMEKPLGMQAGLGWQGNCWWCWVEE